MTKPLDQLEQSRLKVRAAYQEPGEMTDQDCLAAAFELSWQALSENARVLGCLLSLFALAPIPWGRVPSCYGLVKPGCLTSLLSFLNLFPRVSFSLSPLLPHSFRTLEELESCRDEELVTGCLLKQSGPAEYQLHRLIRAAFAAKRGLLKDAEAMQSALAQVVSREASSALSLVSEVPAFQARMLPIKPHVEELAQNGQTWLAKRDSITPSASLARLYEQQRLWQQAEQWHKQALVVSEQCFGRKHTETADRLRILADLYRSQGRDDEAEPLLVRALAIDESKRWPKHATVADRLADLAILYSSQGRNVEAAPLCERALAIYESKLSQRYLRPTNLSKLAYLYCQQGQYDEAERLYTQALKFNESMLGSNNPDTVRIFYYLGIVYYQQRRWEKAESLLVKAVKISQDTLGLEHSDTQLFRDGLVELISSALEEGKAHELSNESITQDILTQLQQH